MQRKGIFRSYPLNLTINLSIDLEHELTLKAAMVSVLFLLFTLYHIFLSVHYYFVDRSLGRNDSFFKQETKSLNLVFLKFI